MPLLALPPGYRVAREGDREGPWTNRLARCSSPYLRQHAHNPVDWYPWGAPALEAARSLDRPVLLSVGYAACHWCHVMERESFMDPTVAERMNAWFIPVKVDREERPDIDGFAMDALLALTGEGGWPLNLWLTPALEPLFGGTYFPPYTRYGLPAFREVLRRVHESWTEGRASGQAAAARLRARLDEDAAPKAGVVAGPEVVDAGLGRLLAEYDWRSGGWGMGAKFPQCPRLELLLQAARLGTARAGEAAAHALEAIDRGGVHDHVGGGFHRYAVDEDWEVPHFEKMLYDNAQLARVYARAHAALGRTRFATVAGLTLEYMLGELATPEGAFWSSQDADDAGGEGAYYTWTPAELVAVLGAAAGPFARAYGVNPGGNMEGGRSVLCRREENTLLSALRPRLRAARDRRPKPALDDKVVVAWNGLALSALAVTGAQLGERRYLDTAARLAELLLATREGALLPRTLAPDAPPGVLDDYALLAEGLLDLYEATGQPRWLLAASEVAESLLARFRDEATGALLHAPAGPRRVVWEEGAEPSGAGVALLVLARLNALGDAGVPTRVLDAALGSASDALARHPTAAPTTLRALALVSRGLRTVVITGDSADPAVSTLAEAARRPWRPDVMVAVCPPDSGLDERFGAFQGKRATRPRAYVCEGSSCLPPASDPERLQEILGV